MKKISWLATGIIFAAFAAANAGEEIVTKNIFENIPYSDGAMGRRELVSENYLQLMQVALKPGQAVPQHNANSNVHLLVVKGEIAVTLNGVEKIAVEGALVPVAFKTPMSIVNKSKDNASFLLIKAPHPNQMGQ